LNPNSRKITWIKKMAQKTKTPIFIQIEIEIGIAIEIETT